MAWKRSLGIGFVLLVLLHAMIPADGQAASHILTFSLMDATAPVSNDSGTIYRYDVEQNRLQAVGSGDVLRWSPSGRYLAMAETVNDSTSKYLGRMITFTIYDMETGGSHTWDYLYGQLLDWSPDERYLLAAGEVSASSGANAWVNFLNADGSGDAPATGPGYVDGMSGARGGIFPLGWVGDGVNTRLLVHDIGVRRDQYALIDPETGEKVVIAGDMPAYRPIERGWGEIGVAQSSDYRYAAVTRVAADQSVNENFSTFLLLIDMNDGTTQTVVLPQATGVLISQLAWRPNH